MKNSGARILVVDDEREILRALQRNLTAHGYEVWTAESGEQALTEITAGAGAREADVTAHPFSEHPSRDRGHTCAHGLR